MMLLELIFPKHIVANAIILFAFVFYIFLFYKIKVFKPIYIALKKNKIFFLLIFLILLLLSFFNGWRTHIPYDEEEHVAISMFISKHFFLHEVILPRPLAFPVFLSFFNVPSFYYSQFVGRLISFIVTFLSSIILFAIYEKLRVKKWMAYAFTFLFSIAPYNLFYSTLNKPEAFAVFFTLLFIYLFLEYSFNDKKENFPLLYFLSLFLSLIRFELIVISFSFLIFLFFKQKYNRTVSLIYFLSLSIIFIFSYLVFSGVNSIVFGFNQALFDFSKVTNSFLLKLILSPWLLFFVLFLMFVLNGISKNSSKKQSWFFIILFLSFVLLSVVYSFYSYSEEPRYQKLLYPFLFIGLSYIKNFNSLFKNERFFVIFVVFLVIIYSSYFIYTSKENIRIVLQPITLADDAFNDISKNADCFNDSIVYTALPVTKLIYDFNQVSLHNDKSWVRIFFQESKYSDIKHHIYLLELISYNYGPLPKDEFQNKTALLSSYQKISELCPGLKNETKKYLFYLDKPLSEYLKN